MREADRKQISYLPTQGLCYDPCKATYWDKNALDLEIKRVFEVCHGCRMCFKYCDSFPILFRLIDEQYSGDVQKITALDTQRVMDACFQCKLCEVQCPYTPHDQHEFQLDFPKLVHRYQAIRYQRGKQQKKLRLKVLQDPDRAAMMARASFGLANVMNQNRVHRWFMQRLIGIDERKLLPEFSQATFESWAQRAGLIDKGFGGDVVLFPTCFVQANEPQIGIDTVEVLQKSSVDVRCVKGLQCCGMPAWERGHLGLLRKKAKINLRLLTPYVEAGAKVVVINPTCSMMLRREYPTLVEEKHRDSASRLAEAVVDPSEYLWGLRREGRFNSAFKSSPGERIAYHAPCHLRAQRVGFKGRDLLRVALGTTMTTVLECCGHNGSHAMTVEGFEYSIRVGQKAFDAMKDMDAQIWATECPLAAIQFQQHTGVKPMHPMSILARAYRDNGFCTSHGAT